MVTRVLMLGGLLLAAGVTEAAQAPELVPAALARPRGGLGNVLAKLQAGKEVRIGYFGGSITAQNGWRVKTLKWFQDRFPQAKVSEINGAIGGTGSDLGVYRFRYDVLRHHPDLVFVEFSVNDGGASPENIHRGMEGIVRQAWREDPTIDFCFVYTFRVGYEKDLDRGLCPRAATADEVLADHYGIPSINMALRVAQLAQEGRLIFQPAKDEAGKELPAPAGVVLFSTDGVHPLDAGHDVYLQVIGDAIGAMRPAAAVTPHELKPPLRADNWEQAKLVPITAAMLSPGWTKLSPDEGLGKQFGGRLPEIWEGRAPGDRITFRFRGTAARLYDIVGPDGGQAVCTLDGQASAPRPRFDWYCTYWRLATLGIGDGLTDGEHTVTVEIHPDQPDRSPVTERVKNEPNFDPKKYDGTVLRVGWIMLIGDLLP